MADMATRNPKQTYFGPTEGMRKIIDKENKENREESRGNLEMTGHKIYDSIEKRGEDLPKTPEEVQNQIGVDQIPVSKVKHSDIPPDRWHGADAIPWEVRKNIRTDRKTGKPIIPKSLKAR